MKVFDCIDRTCQQPRSGGGGRLLVYDKDREVLANGMNQSHEDPKRVS